MITESKEGVSGIESGRAANSQVVAYSFGRQILLGFVHGDIVVPSANDLR